MQSDFWLDRWRSGQIGFHQQTINNNLKKFWPTLRLPARSRILVPLCGKTLDLQWLCDQGYEVIGVELSEIALEGFCLENGVAARRQSLPDFDLYQTENLQLFKGDFFALTPAIAGPIAAVYDRGALISWAPELRRQYAAHLASLMQRHTEALLITLEYDQAMMRGPPFSVGRTELGSLFPGISTIRELSRRNALPDEPRFVARGVTRLSEVCYQLSGLTDASSPDRTNS